MKQFVSFVRKEFYHITRDRLTLYIMLALPIVLLIILGFAISTEYKNTSVIVVDYSKSAVSQEFIQKIDNNAYFSLSAYLGSEAEVETAFRRGKGKAAIVIPADFGDDLLRTGGTNVQLILDASDPNEASTIANYFQMELMQFQQEGAVQVSPQYINQDVKMLYNPQMDSAYNFVPGLMGMIMMLICTMMTSISIVKEKEMGTMEILLVSPLSPATIILAKAIPYLVVAILDVAGILAISYFLLGVPINGNLGLVFLLSFMFTFAALALGLLISSVTQTQQTAMMMSAVGLLLPSMLLSGLIFPLENMPVILQGISCVIPARWFTDALRDVMIRGLGFTAIWKEFSILLLMTVFLLGASIKSFKNRL